uniref:Uncharacterized protein n=1 Tax=Romanomermis culicivorax TaxID=13658 RepID=A0A915IJS1_ROMCU
MEKKRRSTESYVFYILIFELAYAGVDNSSIFSSQDLWVFLETCQREMNISPRPQVTRATEYCVARARPVERLRDYVPGPSGLRHLLLYTLTFTPYTYIIPYMLKPACISYTLYAVKKLEKIQRSLA